MSWLSHRLFHGGFGVNVFVVFRKWDLGLSGFPLRFQNLEVLGIGKGLEYLKDFYIPDSGCQQN